MINEHLIAHLLGSEAYRVPLSKYPPSRNGQAGMQLYPADSFDRLPYEPFQNMKR